MRKIAVMTVTLVLMLSFVGCTDKTISYNSNLGLDLNGIDYESVEFNVYHSNTQDHKWELLKTFSCSLKSRSRASPYRGSAQDGQARACSPCS